MRFFSILQAAGAILIGASFPVCATEQAAFPSDLALTYRKAIHLALAKNFQIRSAEIDPQIAQARQLSQSGAFDPTVRFSYTFDENQQNFRALSADDPAAAAQAGRFARQTGSTFDTAVTGLTPWGLTYDAGANVTRSTGTNVNGGRYNAFVGASIVQPLLRNFGTDVNLAQLRIARADLAISEWQLRQRIIDVLTETASAYNELYFSIENLAVERRSRDLAMQTLKDNRRRAEIGVMSPLDIVQAQSDVADREQRVLVAERSVFDNENALKQLVTNEVAGVLKTHLRIEPPPFGMAFSPELDSDLKRAFELRPDYRQGLLDIQKRNITVVFTRNQTLPQLDLVASLGLNGVDSTLGRSIGAIGDPSQLDVNVGAVFSLPIPNREARGQFEVSKLQVAQALVDLKRLEQSIFVEADNAAGRIDTATKRIEAARAATRFARETLEAGQSRLASGTATTFEVLQFQRDLATAEISEVRALTDRLIAIAEYQRRVGSTLIENGIRIEIEMQKR